MTAISNIRKRGRPSVGSTGVYVKLLPEQLATVQAWMARQPDNPSRPEAIRRLVELGLKAKSK